MKPEALKPITEIELEAAVRGLFRPVKNRQVKHDNRLALNWNSGSGWNSAKDKTAKSCNHWLPDCFADLCI